MNNEVTVKNRIRDWKGLFYDKPRRTKIQAFLVMSIVAASMTFTQLGFIGVGANGTYICYVMGLLLPVVVTAYLLGKGIGTLQGLLCGGLQFLHARFQPLNPVESYFVFILNSFVLFAFAGFILGLFFAIALHNNPSGKRKNAYIAIACAIASILLTLAFAVNTLTHALISILTASFERGSMTNLPPDVINALSALGSLTIQCLLDFLLLLAATFITDLLVRKYNATHHAVSVRTSFGTWMFVVVMLVFCSLSALSYVAITLQSSADAKEDMDESIRYIGNQLLESEASLQELISSERFNSIPVETLETIVSRDNLDSIVGGYSLQKDGTIVVFYSDMVLYSNSDAYPKQWTTEKLFGEGKENYVTDLVNSGETREIMYDTRSPDAVLSDEGTFSNAELAYVRAANYGGYYVMMAKPFSVAFSNRQATMTWSTLFSFALLAVVYVLTGRLLSKNVVAPIDRTNDSLALITEGKLDEKVQESSSIEFASLSDGINTTVDALKGYIDVAEKRMEQELSTAKAIQKSALPRVFPPFPEVDKFDIFASMDAAKEVGGDFYNYFLIDDHTLGFMIADVSGKGVPGALFMMAAKTELENYISTGMELSQAIATANRRLCANNDAGMFVTVWAATLDYSTGELTYVNAGHNFPLLRHGSSGEWEWLKKKCGLFLGTFETAKYRQETITLVPGDELLLYTDGVNEAFNVNEEEYGNDRLEEFLVAHNNMHSREIVRSLRADVARWAEDAEQSDDVTILALEYGVAPEVTGSITVDAVLENLDQATSLVNTELVNRLCPVDVQHKVEVALEELFVNVCRYAYAGQDEPGKVHVRYAYGTDPSSITVELRDKGVPFDPIKREDPTKPSSVQEAKIGGLGIYMVRKSMDDFTYMRSGDTNVVVIKKGW